MRKNPYRDNNVYANVHSEINVFFTIARLATISVHFIRGKLNVLIRERRKGEDQQHARRFSSRKSSYSLPRCRAQKDIETGEDGILLE